MYIIGVVEGGTVSGAAGGTASTIGIINIVGIIIGSLYKSIFVKIL